MRLLVGCRIKYADQCRSKRGSGGLVVVVLIEERFV
jgi:hypothetical protein